MWTQSVAEAPNGRRCRVLCRVLQGAKWGCRGLQRQRRLQAPPLPAASPACVRGGGVCPQTLFHLLCFHTGPPSSQFWEWALRAPSDPPLLDPPLSPLIPPRAPVSAPSHRLRLHPSIPPLFIYFLLYFSECLFHFFFFCESSVPVSVFSC